LKQQYANIHKSNSAQGVVGAVNSGANSNSPGHGNSFSFLNSQIQKSQSPTSVPVPGGMSPGLDFRKLYICRKVFGQIYIL
jgi:hypothetical protein